MTSHCSTESTAFAYLTLTVPAELPLAIVAQLQQGSLDPQELFDVELIGGQAFGLPEFGVVTDGPLIEVEAA